MTRAPMIGDVIATARAVLAVESKEQIFFARRLVCEAQLADLYRRETGRAHPKFGNGSLMSAALAHPQVNHIATDDRRFMAAVSIVLRTILDQSTT